jgi:glycosyltransferase involved in cell wall biosynthesis
MRVLLVHNRYRIEGGEERSVELQLDALRRAGVAHALLERRSSELSRTQAARALLRGGRDEDDVESATRELDADVVHVHNMLPLPGPRGLEAARAAGASVLLHLHNLRLFCAIGVAARDGGPCFRCHHRNTLPGLALNCRGSLPEAAVYATALARHQPAVFDAVDRFVVPSSYAAGQSALLGVPADRLAVLPHYLPAEVFAERSRADQGSYALVASRLSPEKGIDVAIGAAASTGIPLRVAGEGPAAAELAALAERSGAPVEFVGRLERVSVAREFAGAAMLLMPSRYHEFAPYSALEAMAAGVPVIASSLGGLPEMLGARRCVPPGDAAALAARMTALWESPELRRADGDELIARARAGHGEERYVSRLLELYSRFGRIRTTSAQ